MADNVTLKDANDAEFTTATDDVAGVHFQRMKLVAGADGSATDVSLGQKAKSASLPVTLASDEDLLAALNKTVPLTHAELVNLASTDYTPAATTRLLRVGGLAGDVKVDTLGGETIVLPNLQPGESLPLQVTRIYKVGTAATSIVVFW